MLKQFKVRGLWEFTLVNFMRLQCEMPWQPPKGHTANRECHPESMDLGVTKNAKSHVCHIVTSEFVSTRTLTSPDPARLTTRRGLHRQEPNLQKRGRRNDAQRGWGEIAPVT